MYQKKEVLPDYKLHIFEIAYLTDEQMAAFQSDFRYVAEFLFNTYNVG